MTNDIVKAGCNGLQAVDPRQELIDRWASFLEVSKKTKATYLQAIKPLMIFFASKQIALSEATRQNFVDYRTMLRTTPINEGKNKGKQRSAATVNLYLTAARLFFQWLSTDETFTDNQGKHIYSNITLHVKGAKIGNDHKKDALSAANAAKLLKSIDRDSLKGKRDYAILALTASAGLRTIELARAKVADISFSGERCYLRVQGKGRSDKGEKVLIARQALDAIRNYLDSRGIVIGSGVFEPQADAPLFASCSRRNKGKALTPKSISRIVRLALVRSGLKTDRLSAHSLRHTAATLALKSGADIVQVQQMLRHRKISTTMIYINDLERERNQSEQLAADAIFDSLSAA